MARYRADVKANLLDNKSDSFNVLSFSWAKSQTLEGEIKEQAKGCMTTAVKWMVETLTAKGYVCCAIITEKNDRSKKMARDCGFRLVQSTAGKAITVEAGARTKKTYETYVAFKAAK